MLATVAVLGASVEPASVLGRVAALGPIQWLGRVSYGWYLWHFPMLVLAEQRLDSFGPAIRLVVVAVSLVAAALSLRLLENPVRFQPWLMARPVRNVGLAALLLVGSLAVAGLLNPMVAAAAMA